MNAISAHEKQSGSLQIPVQCLDLSFMLKKNKQILLCAKAVHYFNFSKFHIKCFKNNVIPSLFSELLDLYWITFIGNVIIGKPICALFQFTVCNACTAIFYQNPMESVIPAIQVLLSSIWMSAISMQFILIFSNLCCWVQVEMFLSVWWSTI